MTTLVAQGMVADELTRAMAAQIVLFAARFLAVSSYLCTVAIGAEKFYIYFHRTKIALSALIATYLSKHTF
jgi:hypothetical protein